MGNVLELINSAGKGIEGRADYPLLFDRNLKSKPAYYAVIKTAQNNQ